MKPLFPMGQLHASPAFLDAVPRPAMAEAMKLHFSGELTGPPTEGEPVVTAHNWNAVRFYVETNRERTETRIWLADE